MATPYARSPIAATGPAPAHAALDRQWRAALGHLTGGASPWSLPRAWAHWAEQLTLSPFHAWHLAIDAGRRVLLATGSLAGVRSIEPCPGDHRFDHPAWQGMILQPIMQSFLQVEAWVKATGAVDGLAPSDQRRLAISARQWLDMLSPANMPWLNPAVIALTAETGGANLAAGWARLLRDAAGMDEAPVAHFRPGREVAITPGRIVFRNRLMELIQYAPTTSTVRPEPVLIVPAWIMKHYILDLSPANSLVRWLVGQGFTVFMISWKSPGADMADTGLDDYRTMGIHDALDAVEAITAADRTHCVGYCLGGTMLAIAAAAMGRRRHGRLASLTLLAAQTDFSEAGELQLFIGEAELDFLESLTAEQGFLDSHQMGGAFQLLRSRDLVWSRLTQAYLMGEADPVSDLMDWNRDGTRLLARMHRDYLLALFLNNDLAGGRFMVEDEPVALSNIGVPLFGPGTWP